MKTQFLIKFLEDYKNCQTISFVDETIYNPDIAITTPIITVGVPNFDKKVAIPYTPSKVNHINLNSIGLEGLQTCLPNMLDGLWILELSICPNDEMKKTFYYYNVCSLMNMLKDNLCADTSESNIEKLINLRDKILVIQEMGSCNVDKANVMYNEIYKDLSKKCCN